MSSRLEMQWVPIGSVQLNPDNPRLNDEAVGPVKRSIKDFGFRQPIVVNPRTNLIEAGNTRWKAAKELGLPEIPVIFVDDDELKAMSFVIADNRTHERSSWDEASLAEQLKRLQAEDLLSTSDFGDEDLSGLIQRLEAEEASPRRHPTRADLFAGHMRGFDPFLFSGMIGMSVWDANAPVWLARKRALERDIFGEFSGDTRQGQPGMQHGGGIYGGRNRMAMGSRDGDPTKYASRFDPVLAEVVLTYYMPPEGGTVFDPFMGDVRAVMALGNGFGFCGVDIRREQVEAVERELETLDLQGARLLVADSTQSLDVSDESAELMFSCPPYYDVEIYSDLPGDISTAATYQDFLEAYGRAVAQAARILKQPGFAVFVVGNLRDENGRPVDFRADTVRLFEQAGLVWHDEIIYRQPTGTGPARAYCFRRHRRTLHGHEYVLVFRKGELQDFQDAWPIRDGTVTTVAGAADA